MKEGRVGAHDFQVLVLETGTRVAISQDWDTLNILGKAEPWVLSKDPQRSRLTQMIVLNKLGTSEDNLDPLLWAEEGRF
jgi:hypothetical protein